MTEQKDISEYIRTIRHVDIEHLVSKEVARFFSDNFPVDESKLATPDTLSDWFFEYQEENKPAADFVREIELALSSMHDLPSNVLVSFNFWVD